MIHKKQTHLACLMLALLLHHNASAMETTDMAANAPLHLDDLPEEVRYHIASYLFAGFRETRKDFEERCKDLSRQKPVEKITKNGHNIQHSMSYAHPSGTIIKTRSIMVTDPNSDSDEDEETPVSCLDTQAITYIPTAQAASRLPVKLCSAQCSFKKINGNITDRKPASFFVSPDYSKILACVRFLDNNPANEYMRVFDTSKNEAIKHHFIPYESYELMGIASNGDKYAFVTTKKYTQNVFILKKRNHAKPAKKRRKKHTTTKEFMIISSFASGHAELQRTERAKNFKAQQIQFNQQGTAVALVGEYDSENKVTDIETFELTPPENPNNDMSLDAYFRMNFVRAKKPITN
ncbi:MAG: hypothetical protein WC707_05630 [Candidatus Babeliaceae bacterium]|jgi:hypothetical protein